MASDRHHGGRRRLGVDEIVEWFSAEQLGAAEALKRNRVATVSCKALERPVRRLYGQQPELLAKELAEASGITMENALLAVRSLMSMPAREVYAEDYDDVDLDEMTF